MSGARSLSVVAAVLTALLLPACAGADMGAPGPAEPRLEGPVREDRSALREDACFTDVSADKTLAVSERGYTFETGVADGKYDHPGCPHSWIVDVTDTAGTALSIASGASAVDGANRDWCEGFWSESEVRGCLATPCTWAPFASWSERAKWHAGKGGSSGSCERVITGESAELPSTHRFEKLRVVTQAGWVYWYQGASVRVTTH